MTPREFGVALAKRFAVAGVVVVVILAAAFAIPAATDSEPSREPLATPEFEAESVAATPVPAEGDIEADGSVGNREGVVVIDRSHSNRFDRGDIAPLVRELTALGYGVRFYTGDDGLDEELSNVNAFVVIDPGEEFSREEVEHVQEFTDEGGHLLMVGEPTRKRVSASFFGTSISDQESALTTLASGYGMSLGTAYLYNLETNGGNYKHVVASPSAESDLELDRVTMFTAAAVHARDGTVLLRAAANTHEAGIDGSARHPVAVTAAEDNAMLLGDKSLLRDDRYNVGDNERFAAFLVEFLLSGERISGPLDGGTDTDGTATDGDATDGDGAPTGPTNNTTTPQPTTPAADRLAPTGPAAAPTPATATTGRPGEDAVARPLETERRAESLVG